MSRETQKVVAYITNGRRLLVFEHTEFPEAGIQVPAGTVDPGEDPQTAVLREAYEETGLLHLELVRALGKRIFEWDGRNYVRHFFHLFCPGQPPERWRHREEDPSDEASEHIEFELYWAGWPDGIPALAAEMDALLAALDWDSLPG
jgi:8-oxo-dGTP pyrophosphatase MutT (NUDIX family)